MLRIAKSPWVAATGDRVWLWKSQIRLTVPNSTAPGVTLEFLLDSGSVYSVVPLYCARALGTSPDEIRRLGRRLALRTASRQPLTAYLRDVRLRLEDPQGNVAEWDSKVAFQDGRIGEALAGHVGFFDRFRVADQGFWLDLDPVSAGPPQFVTVISGTAPP